MTYRSKTMTGQVNYGTISDPATAVEGEEDEAESFFDPKSARQVRGKIISTNFAVLLAGLNGTLHPF